MGREVGEGFRIGNSCTPMEDSKIVKKKKKEFPIIMISGTWLQFSGTVLIVAVLPLLK